MFGRARQWGAPTLALVLPIALVLVGATSAAADPDTQAPDPFDIVADAGEFQTAYSVAAPYNSIYVTWEATTDDTSAVSYEVTVDDAVVRLVTDVDGYILVTKRVEVPEGRHVVGVTAVDAAGNRQPAEHTLDVVVDKVSPTFTSFPLLLLRIGRVTDAGYPVRYTWTGTDVGTGLAQVTIGPSSECCFTVSPELTSFDFTVEPESPVAWRLRLYDGVGRIGRVIRDAYISPVPWSESRHSNGWTQRPDSSAIDDSEWVSSTKGDRFSFKAVGRSVAWVATTGPTRGRADVLLNGRVVDTVSLTTAKRHEARVVWASKLPLGQESTVTIVNRSKGSRQVVGVDALLLQA